MSDRKSQILIRELGQKPKLALIKFTFCPWILPVPQSSQFSSSYALGKPFASQNRAGISVDKYPSISSLQMEAIDGFTLLVARWVIRANFTKKQSCKTYVFL